MTQMLRVTRNLPTETWSFEPKESYDDEGAPVYGTALEFEANTLEYDGTATSKADQYVELPDGTKHRIPITLYVRGDEANVPDVEDRLTRSSDQQIYVVAVKKTVTGLWYERSAPDHYRLSLRFEGDV